MIKKILAWLAILAFSLFSIYPILYVLSVSLRGDNAFASRSLEIFNASSTGENFVNLFVHTDFLLWLRNSMMISVATTLLGLALAASSAYALSRYRFRGRNLML